MSDLGEHLMIKLKDTCELHIPKIGTCSEHVLKVLLSSTNEYLSVEEIRQKLQQEYEVTFKGETIYKAILELENLYQIKRIKDLGEKKYQLDLDSSSQDLIYDFGKDSVTISPVENGKIPVKKRVPKQIQDKYKIADTIIRMQREPKYFCMNRFTAEFLLAPISDTIIDKTYSGSEDLERVYHIDISTKNAADKPFSRDDLTELIRDYFVIEFTKSISGAGEKCTQSLCTSKFRIRIAEFVRKISPVTINIWELLNNAPFDEELNEKVKSLIHRNTKGKRSASIVNESIKTEMVRVLDSIFYCSSINMATEKMEGLGLRLLSALKAYKQDIGSIAKFEKLIRLYREYKEKNIETGKYASKNNPYTARRIADFKAALKSVMDDYTKKEPQKLLALVDFEKYINSLDCNSMIELVGKNFISPPQFNIHFKKIGERKTSSKVAPSTIYS